MKNFKFQYIIFGLLMMATAWSCNIFETLNPNFDQNNTGFLAYSSGIGITEGISIATYNSGGMSGYILLASTDNGREENYFLVKTDKQGNILANRTYEEANVDNRPREVVVIEDTIFVLGDRFDLFTERVLPYVQRFNVSDLDFMVRPSKNFAFESTIFIDYYNNFFQRVDSIYSEEAVGMVMDGNRVIVASNLATTEGRIVPQIYSILDDDSVDVNSDFFVDDFFGLSGGAFSNKMLTARKLKKGPNGNYFLMGDARGGVTEENMSGYFMVEFTPQGNFVNAWTDTLDYNYFPVRAVYDFEFIDNENVIFLYRKKNQAVYEIANISPSNNNLIASLKIDSLGAVEANDFVFIDNTVTPILDNTKGLSINKVGNHFMITGIRKGDYAIIVDKRTLNFNGANSTFTSEWGNPWEGYKPFNNTTGLFDHRNHNIGKVIQRIDGNGYAIIGTHDFLDATKMVLLQLDESGNYIE